MGLSLSGKLNLPLYMGTCFWIFASSYTAILQKNKVLLLNRTILMYLVLTPVMHDSSSQPTYITVEAEYAPDDLLALLGY